MDVSDVRNLYINLLMRVLANTIYSDPSIAPWSQNKEYDQSIRAEGRDWPSLAHTMVGLRRLENLSALVQRVLDEKIPGDLIETGVWRGGCCILMRGILKANGVTTRKVYVADSFQGLPPPTKEQDAGDTHHTFSELSIGEAEVRSNFEKYDLLDEQVVFVKGFFKDTLQKIGTDKLALLRLDGDMYESTIVALEQLYPKLSPGGFVIIDDYGAIPNCQKAVLDYRKKFEIIEPTHTIDWTGIWWQKTSN